MTDAERTFVRVDDDALIRTIGRARQRLVFIAPGVRKQVAEALAKAMDIIPRIARGTKSGSRLHFTHIGYGFGILESLGNLLRAPWRWLSVNCSQLPGRIRIMSNICSRAALRFGDGGLDIEVRARLATASLSNSGHGESSTGLAFWVASR